MKKTLKGNIYYFVDESGDPCFYDKHGNYIVGQEGCSKMLMLGFIQTDEPKHVRKCNSWGEFRVENSGDTTLNSE